MEIIALPKFEREYKKYSRKLQEKIKEQIKFIRDNPKAGEVKKGDLLNIKVYKFKDKNQLYLLAYEADYPNDKLYLYTIGTHEGFYKKLKKYLK